MSQSKAKQVSVRNVAQLARKHAENAINTLVRCMGSDDDRIAMDAASRILDRGIGKPLTMTADVTDKLDEFTDDELADAIADIRNRIATSERVGEEAGVSDLPQTSGGVPTIQ